MDTLWNLSSTTKRVLCVWLPNWPVQRLWSVRPELRDRPLGLYHARNARCEIAACSRTMWEQGVRPGMSLAEASTLTARGLPVFEAYEPEQDREFLRNLARWCRRYSPLVAIENDTPPESLLIEVGGSAHLFGGEAALLAQIHRDFRRQGFSVRAAVAEGPAAAWAVAHYGWRIEGLPHVVPSSEQAGILRQLPVEALRLPERTLRALRELEICTIGQLERLPRSTLPARFGPALLKQLERLFARETEILVPERFPEPVRVRQVFEFPTRDRRLLRVVLERLLERVLEKLEPRREGILQLVCRFVLADRREASFRVGLIQPCNSLKHLRELIDLQLETLRLEHDAGEVELRAAGTAAIDSRQETLFADADREATRRLDALLERLSNRLGEHAVLRPRLHPDAQPEYAVRCEPLIGSDGTSEPTDCSPPAPGSRPLILFPRPLPIEVLRAFPEGPPARFRSTPGTFDLAHTWGPERIETGWWRSHPIARDYYHVEATTGHRFWIFQRLSREDWFLHGG